MSSAPINLDALFQGSSPAQPSPAQPSPAAQGTVDLDSVLSRSNPEDSQSGSANPSSAIDLDSIISGHAPSLPQPTSQQPQDKTFTGKVKNIWNSDEGTLGKVWDTANTPMLDLKREGATGVEAGVEDFASGFTSPLNAALTVATAGAGPLLERMGISAATMESSQFIKAAKTASKLAAAGFTAVQLKGISEEAPSFVQAVKNGDTQKALEIGTGMLLQGGAAALGAKHTANEFGMFDGANEPVTSADLLVGRHTESLKRDTDVATRFNQAMKKAVPNQVEREALHFYGEAGGSTDTLAAWEKKVTESTDIAPDLQRQVVRDLQKAQNLSPKAIEQVSSLRDLYESVHHKATAVDASGQPTDTHIMEGSSYRDNYFARAPWEHEPDEFENVNNAKEQLGDGSQDHTQRRVFESTIDGVLKGYKPRKVGGRYILDSADLASDYYRTMGREMAKNQLTKRAAAMYANDMRPLAVPGGVISKFDSASRDKEGALVPNGDQITMLNSDGLGSHALTKVELAKIVRTGKLQDMLDSGKIIDRGPRPDAVAPTTSGQAPATPKTEGSAQSAAVPENANLTAVQDVLRKAGHEDMVDAFAEDAKDQGWTPEEHIKHLEAFAKDHGVAPEKPGSAPLANKEQEGTKQFKQWFGDSKVVDEAGAPKPVFHGTRQDFDTFDRSTLGRSTDHPTADLGFFFSEDPEVAEIFAGKYYKNYEPQSVPGANIKPAYLNIQNPLVVSAQEFADIAQQSRPGGIGAAKNFNPVDYLEGKAIDGNHDGILIKGDKEFAEKNDASELKADTWVAFKPNQIKSSIGNDGQYSRENPSILHSKGKDGTTSEQESKGPVGEFRTNGNGEHALWVNKDAMYLLMRAEHKLFPDVVEKADPKWLNNGVSYDQKTIEGLQGELAKVKGVRYKETAAQLHTLLEEAKGKVGKEGLTVMGNFGRGIGKTIDTAREEYNHAWQRIFSNNGDTKAHLKPKDHKALYREIPDSAHVYFDAYGYPTSSRVAELGAKLLAGKGDNLGMTDEQAAAWLNKYYDAVIAKHGDVAIEQLKHVVGVAKRLRDERIANGKDNGAGLPERAAVDGGARSPQEGRGEGDLGTPQKATSGAGSKPGTPEEIKDENYPGRYRFNTDDYTTIKSRRSRATVYGGNDGSLLQAHYAFHPDVAKQVKLILNPEKSWLQKNPVASRIMGLSTQAKQSLLSLSGFHWVQIGLRGVESGINPLKPLLEMKDGVKGWDLDNPNNPDQQRQLKLIESNGIAPGIDHGAHSFAEGLQGHGPISKIPGIGPVVDSVNNALFGPNGYIDRMKLNAALDFERRLRPTMPDEMARYKAAGQLANYRFGGLNYLAMGRSQEMRDILRLTLLAPDWLESNMRDAVSTLGPYGKLSRFDFARIAMYNFAAAQTLNLLTTGKMHPEQPFGVVSKDGQKVYSVRTLPADIFHALTQPMDYATNRLNPLISRTGVEMLTGRDRQGHIRDMGEQIKDLLENVSPIPLHGVTNTLTGNFHPGESGGDYVRSAMGLTTKPNNTPAQDLAYKLSSQNSSSGRIPSEEAAHFRRVMEYEDRLRSGDTSAADDIQKDLQSGKVTLSDYRQVMKGSTTSRLQAVLNRLPMSDAIDVWNLATNDERDELSPIMAKKMASFRKTEAQKLTPSERSHMDVKMASVLDTMFTHAGIQ